MNSFTLEDLLKVKLEGPPLSKFSADAAVWKDRSRRVHQKPRKPYKRRKPKQTSSAGTVTLNNTESSSDSDSQLLIMWDDWFDLNSSDASSTDSDSVSEQE